MCDTLIYEEVIIPTAQLAHTVWKMKHLGNTDILWTVPVCSGQYRYALGSTGLFLGPVCCGQYRYTPSIKKKSPFSPQFYFKVAQIRGVFIF